MAIQVYVRHFEQLDQLIKYVNTANDGTPIPQTDIQKIVEPTSQVNGYLLIFWWDPALHNGNPPPEAPPLKDLGTNQ